MINVELELEFTALVVTALELELEVVLELDVVDDEVVAVDCGDTVEEDDVTNVELTGDVLTAALAVVVVFCGKYGFESLMHSLTVIILYPQDFT